MSQINYMNLPPKPIDAFYFSQKNLPIIGTQVPVLARPGVKINLQPLIKHQSFFDELGI